MQQENSGKLTGEVLFKVSDSSRVKKIKANFNGFSKPHTSLNKENMLAWVYA